MPIWEDKKIINRARVRNHLANGQKPGGYTPYPGNLHNPDTDEKIDWRDEIRKVLWSLPEGAGVSIVLQIEQPPADLDPEDYWVLVAPHTYRHVQELPNYQKKELAGEDVKKL